MIVFIVRIVEKLSFAEKIHDSESVSAIFDGDVERGRF